MSRHQFRKLRDDDPRTLAVLDILLLSPDGDKVEEVEAIVDSGSDLSVFPLAKLEKIGVEFGSGKTASAETGLGGGHYPVGNPPMVDCFVEGHYVSVTAIGNPNVDYAMLGLHDFFNHFRVSFEQREGCFTLEPLDPECCGHSQPTAP